jgi:hypothetical protein
MSIPGLTEQAESVLVNDLDLVVEGPDSASYYGNMDNEPDRLNNVESVRIAEPKDGDYRITVRGHRVAQGPQPYALVVAGQRVVSGRQAQAEEPGTVTEEEPEGEALNWVLVTAVVLGAMVLVAAAGLIVLLRSRSRAGSRSVRPALSTGRGVMGPTPEQKSGSRTAFLTVEAGPFAGQRVAIGKSPFSLGRGENNDWVLASGPVSRRHAQLVLQNSRWLLQDLESSNGTFLNRQRLASPQPLHDGDLISIGDTTLHFSMPPTTPGPEPGTQPSRSRRLLAIGVALVTVLLVAVSIALLASALSGSEEEGSSQPGLPTVELPGIDLPTAFPSIELPTGIPSALPSIEVPTGIPTAFPTNLPTGMPAPTGALPIPTGDLQIPTIEFPAP